AVVAAAPAAVPAVLVFPVLGVAHAGLGLDVVEPGVFHALAGRPDVLAGDRTGMAADAFVQVQDHGDLRADFHVPDSSGLGLGGHFVGLVHPVDFLHFADDHEFVAVRADRAVVIEAIGQLGVAADHVRGLEHGAGDGIVDAAALARDFRPRHVHDLFLGVVHHGHAFGHPLADHGARDQRAVDVEDLDPVVVHDARLGRIDLGHPDDRAAARKRQHDQVVRIGGVDTPFLMR